MIHLRQNKPKNADIVLAFSDFVATAFYFLAAAHALFRHTMVFRVEKIIYFATLVELCDALLIDMSLDDRCTTVPSQKGILKFLSFLKTSKRLKLILWFTGNELLLDPTDFFGFWIQGWND